ncbi:MAG: hypothetical protein [Bacteriophage sp.]|nr:MAG: hypothetical protein [Bacteriophage sp.]
MRGDTETVPTGSITIQSGKGSVTIPQGVNVVLVEQYWNLNGEISFTLPFRNNAENNSAYGGFTSNEIASWFVDHNHQLVDCVMEFV